MLCDVCNCRITKDNARVRLHRRMIVAHHHCHDKFTYCSVDFNILWAPKVLFYLQLLLCCCQNPNQKDKDNG